MKKLITLLMALWIAAPAMAAPEQPLVKESELPAAFRAEPPFIQNRICGELMASMYRMSVNLWQMSGKPKVRDAALLTGTRAMVFVKANANITTEEAARAKAIADKLEQSASPDAPAIKPYLYCEQRVQRWIKEGVVSSADYLATEREVKAALDLEPAPKKLP